MNIKWSLSTTWSTALNCASSSNIKIIQRSQNKILRAISNEFKYVTNETICDDLDSETAINVQITSYKYHYKVSQHSIL